MAHPWRVSFLYDDVRDSFGVGLFIRSGTFLSAICWVGRVDFHSGTVTPATRMGRGGHAHINSGTFTSAIRWGWGRACIVTVVRLCYVRDSYAARIS